MALAGHNLPVLASHTVVPAAGAKGWKHLRAGDQTW